MVRLRSIAFIGLGNMGRRMLPHLVQAGHKVHAFDVSAAALEHAARRGATPASSVREAVEKAEADVVLTMLPSSMLVRKVYDELLSVSSRETLLIDSSTVEPGTAVLLSQRHCDGDTKGAPRFVDAPVSGGVGGAENGSLTFMCGAVSIKEFEEAREVLEPMGAKIVHCGSPGTGQAAKLANNSLLAASMVATAEAFLLGERLGVDKRILADIINTSSGRCWSSEKYNPCPGVMEGVPSSRAYEGGFGCALMKKDLTLAMEAAQKVGASIPLASSAHALYTLINDHGYGDKDFSYVFQFLQGRKPDGSEITEKISVE